MWLVILPLGALAAALVATAVKGGTGTNDSASSSAAAAAAAAAAGASELRYLTDMALRLASQNAAFALTPEQREQIAQIATKYGLTQMAAAIRGGGVWPTTEMWPGTNMSISSYLGQQWAVSPYNLNRGTPTA